jgi:hypothetical protein
MSDIIVPGQQPPTYPQVNATVTPQGVAFTIQLGPTVSILHLVSHDDMDNIEQIRRAEKRKMQENAQIIKNVMEGR